MVRTYARLAVCVLLLAVSASSRRELKDVEYPTDVSISETILYNNAYPDSQNKPIDINDPRLTHKGAEFAPDQVHITFWTATSVLVSWATGLGRIDGANNAPMAYDPNTVQSIVKYGMSADSLSMSITGANDGMTSKRLVYEYVHAARSGDINGQNPTYQSPIIHHVVVPNLMPGMTYFYQVGDPAYGFSQVFNFTMPKQSKAAYPFTFGVAADIGQTENSTTMMQKLLADKPDLFVLVGDLTYSDDYYTNGTSAYDIRLPNREYFINYPPRWDTWQRLAQDLIASIPTITIAGNHELESLTLENNVTNKGYNARFPNPRDPSMINTSPNDPHQYWDQSYLPQKGQFFPPAISDLAVTNNTYYSVNVGPAHIIMLNNYVPYGPTSQMYKWLENDLANVDRTVTPWLFVTFHAPWYHTYVPHYKENDEMRMMIEPLLYKYQVDAVFNGHVHAYERSAVVYQFKPNTCGIMHFTMGDGGNIEGLYKQFVDQTESVPGVVAKTPGYCSNTSLYAPASYQPSYSGRGYIDPNEPFCHTSQPEWSDWREPAFGHGLFTLHNDTHAEWQWKRNIDGQTYSIDHIMLMKNPAGASCSRKVWFGFEF